MSQFSDKYITKNFVLGNQERSLNTKMSLPEIKTRQSISLALFGEKLKTRLHINHKEYFILLFFIKKDIMLRLDSNVAKKSLQNSKCSSNNCFVASHYCNVG